MAKVRDSDDEAAFTELYDRRAGIICGWFNKRVGEVDSPDQQQITWLRTWHRRKSYDSKFSFLRFLFLIATNTLCEYLRKRGKLPPTVEIDATLEAVLSLPPDQIDVITDLFQRLTTEERKLLYLVYIEGVTRKAIAAAGKKGHPDNYIVKGAGGRPIWSEPTLRTIERRALEKLRLVESESSFVEARVEEEVIYAK